MTQDEIIRMAREAGFINLALEPKITRFAALVAAHEREACAKVCEEVDNNMESSWKRNAVNCALAIRARGDKCFV